MTENMKRFIEGVKATDFYKTTITNLYYSEHDPHTLYYTASRIHKGVEVDAAIRGLGPDISLIHKDILEEVDTTSMLIKSTLQRV